MTCAALALLAGAVSIAEPGGDMRVLAPIAPGRFQLCYRNDGAQLSPGGTLDLTVGDLTVRTHVVVVDGPETLTVTPPEGWFVWPGDAAEQAVEDGAEIIVEIMGGTS